MEIKKNEQPKTCLLIEREGSVNFSLYGWLLQEVLTISFFKYNWIGLQVKLQTQKNSSVKLWFPQILVKKTKEENSKN